jgi:hypothetical protein
LNELIVASLSAACELPGLASHLQRQRWFISNFSQLLPQSGLRTLKPQEGGGMGLSTLAATLVPLKYRLQISYSATVFLNSEVKPCSTRRGIEFTQQSIQRGKVAAV